MAILAKKGTRIGIDIRTIHQNGGCATYVTHLIPALVEELPDVEFHLFTNSAEKVLQFAHVPRVIVHRLVVPKWALLLYDWFLLPIATRRLGLNIFHGAKSAISPLYRFLGVPTVTTIHDIIPLTHPKTELFLNRLYWLVQIPLAYRVSTAVITISHYARKQLVQKWGERDRLSVIYHGADHALPTMTNNSALRWQHVQRQYGIHKPYVLYLGTVQPRKRVLELITAFWGDRDLRERYVCVIAGKQGWLSEDVADFVRQHHAEESILLIGAVSDEARSLLYEHAAVFAYLSVDEGFGFPVLEAMASGAPVLTSNVSCLPEIVGDAAVCIGANTEKDITDGIRTIVDNPKKREALVTFGRQRFQEFTWKECARQTAEVYRSLCK